jgi:cell division protein FtsB
MDSAYDIYIAADVDNLKSAYAQLWRDYKRVVRENSLLEDEIRRLRERRAYHEKDYTWMTD